LRNINIRHTLRAPRLDFQQFKTIARKSGKGIFPPIGVLSILALTAATVGSPLWHTSIQSLPYDVFLGIAIIFGILLWKIPRKDYSAIFASIFGWLPVFLGAASYAFWYWYGAGYEIGGDFFHAAADVLPVLLLATVIDVRRTNDLEGKQLVLPIAAVFLGEVAALNSLAFPDDTGPSGFAVVSSSLVTAVVALVLAVMADIAPAPADERREAERSLRSAEPDEASARVLQDGKQASAQIEVAGQAEKRSGDGGGVGSTQ
jgi:hypothetical protein